MICKKQKLVKISRVFIVYFEKILLFQAFFRKSEYKLIENTYEKIPPYKIGKQKIP